MNGPGADWGTLKCGCHPDCGVGTALHGQQDDQEMGAGVGVHQRRSVHARRADHHRRGPRAAADQDPDGAQPAAQLLAVARRRRGFSLIDLVKKFDKQSGGQLGGVGLGANPDDRKSDEWLMMFVAGMWFQDLWTYDFRRTEMCIIPYATQMGEISFCAYNTGVGWRQIVENMHKNATVAEWYREHGKHPVYANPRKAAAASREHAAALAEDPQGRPAGRMDAAP